MKFAIAYIISDTEQHETSSMVEWDQETKTVQGLMQTHCWAVTVQRNKDVVVIDTHRAVIWDGSGTGTFLLRSYKALLCRNDAIDTKHYH